MLKREKGFTLVELLAVIVILAIILAIAIPGISGIINSSKRGAFESDAKMIVTSLGYQQLQATVGTAGVTVADDTTLSATDITTLGADSNNYSVVRIINLSPLTICVESKSTSKFGAFSVRATTSTITDITSGTCATLTS